MANGLAQIRFDAANSSYQSNIERIRNMSAPQLEELDKLLSQYMNHTRENVGIVKVLRGGEVSENLFKKIESKAEIVDAQLRFEYRMKKRIDVKTDKVVLYKAYSSSEAKMASQVNDKVATPDQVKDITYTLNKYGIRESHGNGHLKALGSVRDIIKTVKKERLDEELSTKKAKLVVIGQVGRELMEKMKVQPVVIPEVL